MNKRLPCPTCGKRLRNDRALASHTKDAHSLPPRESAFEKKYFLFPLWLGPVMVVVLWVAAIGWMVWSKS